MTPLIRPDFLIAKNGHKYTKEFRRFIANVYCMSSDLHTTLAEATKHCPTITHETVRSWIDPVFEKTLQDRRKRSTENCKTNNPELIKKYRETSYSNEKKRRSEDPLRRAKRVERSKSWAQRNRDKVRAADQKAWEDPTFRQKAYKRKQIRRERDVGFKISENCRTMLHRALHKAGTHKTCKSSEYFGCSPTELWVHLRTLYQPEMTDDNYGEWHIDHIIPVSYFDHTDPEQAKRCWHYTNLQPLWAKDNILKGNKLDWRLPLQ